MTWFAIIGLLIVFGALWAWSTSTAIDSSFDRLTPYPEAVRWTLYALATLIIVAGTIAHSGDCSIDWDGVSNPTVCE